MCHMSHPTIAFGRCCGKRTAMALLKIPLRIGPCIHVLCIIAMALHVSSLAYLSCEEMCRIAHFAVASTMGRPTTMGRPAVLV